MKIASFDIFDTALIRRCGQPRNVFYLTALSLFEDDETKVTNFCIWRNSAEGKAVAKQKTEFVTLEDIYASFESEYFGIDASQAVTKEKEIESQNLVKNPEESALIQRNREAGNEIMYVSDMYLDSSFLTTILKREGLLIDSERVYVSCEEHASKARGSLYAKIKSELKPSAWHHYGDNEHSDVKMARKSGLKATKIASQFTPVENLASKHFRKNSNYEIYSLVEGYIRTARILLGNTPDAEIAANFIAPLYISYVAHILDTATRKGIKKLYFLNRDSYILYKIAQELNVNGIELKYLYVSRRSLVLPSLARMDKTEFLEVFDQKTLIRKEVNYILQFVKCNRKDLADCNVQIAFNTINTKVQEKQVLDALFHSAFTPVWQARIQAEEQLLLKYFEQEGLLDGQSSAFVDVGWLGTSRLMANRVLRNNNHEPVEFFYLGVRKDVLPCKYGVYSTFLKEPVGGLTQLVEQYYSISPYNSVTGYEKDDAGVVIPTFKHEEIKNGDILHTNVSVSLEVIRLLNNSLQKARCLEALKEIALYTIDAINEMNVDICLQSFLKVGGMDAPMGKQKQCFTKKMTFCELLRYSCLSDNVTDCDNVSVVLSVGRNFAKKLKRMHDFTGRIKGRLFRLYMRTK